MASVFCTGRGSFVPCRFGDLAVTGSKRWRTIVAMDRKEGCSVHRVRKQGPLEAFSTAPSWRELQLLPVLEWRGCVATLGAPVSGRQDDSILTCSAPRTTGWRRGREAYWGFLCDFLTIAVRRKQADRGDWSFTGIMSQACIKDLSLMVQRFWSATC